MISANFLQRECAGSVPSVPFLFWSRVHGRYYRGEGDCQLGSSKKEEEMCDIDHEGFWVGHRILNKVRKRETLLEQGN